MIHVVGAVSSTLHQKLKFMFEDKLVIIYKEEGLLVSEMSSFRYVETEEGIAEIPLYCLEFEDVSSATSNQDRTSEVVMSSQKSAKETLPFVLICFGIYFNRIIFIFF